MTVRPYNYNRLSSFYSSLLLFTPIYSSFTPIKYNKTKQ